MTDVITASGLSRAYGRGPLAVDGLDFSIRGGEIFALLGPNGAGKTTTIRLIAGLIDPTAGEVRVNGIPTTDRSHLQEIHDAVGVLPEVPGHYESLSAYRNLRFHGRLHGLSDQQIHDRAHELLGAFDLWERRDDRVATFSKGMKQKVALVRALLHDPSCLVLDEPISGLDPQAAKTVRDFLIDQRRQGKTIVLSTHNLDDADRLSDRVAVIQTRLLALDTPSALKGRLFQRSVTLRLQNGTPAALEVIRQLPFVLHAGWEEPHLLIRLDRPDEDMPTVIEALVRAGYRIQYVEPVAHTLEDAYLRLIQESRAPAVDGAP
ncbi:MAG: ABC transporter ATP-binding protein [Thermoplasmata archaeon]